MSQQKPRLLPLILTACAVVGAIASLLSLDGVRLVTALLLDTAVIGSCLGYYYGRGVRTKRDAVLDELGIIRAYLTSKEDDEYMSARLQSAKKIRVLAINAEMLFRNLPTPFKNAMKSGTTIELLISTPESELIQEMEMMELADGRQPGRSIEECVRDAEPELLSLVRESVAELPERDRQRMGSVSLGYFNTQYRETMIICDEDWVWWTPHLNPARGAERPTLVFQGQETKLTKMCIRHFEAIKRMVEMRPLA